MKKLIGTAAIVTAFMYPNILNAAPSIGAEMDRPAGAVKIASADVTMAKTGIPVFVSNAPETLWNGPRSYDGAEMHQVNSTLYRDEMKGNFRFWSVHSNSAKQNLSFYMYVKNGSKTAVKLYMKGAGYGASLTSKPEPGAAAATNQYLKSQDSKGRYLATIPAGGGYAYKYASGVKDGYSMNYIADYRAVNATTGADAAVTVSDIVTDSEAANANVAAYASSAQIAPTNYLYKNSADDYRGVLRHSGRTAKVNVNLTVAEPRKFVNIADAEPAAYPGEQEPLISSWDEHGMKYNKPTEVVFKGKKRGAFWVTDYTIQFLITKPASHSSVLAAYGARYGTSNNGYIHYKISPDGPLTQYAYDAGKVRLVDTSGSFTIKTMVQPFLSVPLAFYFAAEQ